MTTKRNPVGRVSTADRGSIRRSIAFTHGPQARNRSATDWSVMDSYRAVKVPATSRKGLSKPQYKKTTRKSCAGVLTFLTRTKALNSRAICAVSGGRSCKSSSKSVSGSVRGNGMVCFSCGREGPRFPPCSMPSFSPIYSLSWRLWGHGPPRLGGRGLGEGRQEDTGDWDEGFIASIPDIPVEFKLPPERRQGWPERMDMTLCARQPGLPGKAWEGDGRARQQPSDQEEPEPIPHERVSVCSHTSPDKRSPHVTSSSSVDSHALAHGLTCLAGLASPWLR